MERIKLSDSEWKILSKLWDNNGMTIMQLTACLKEETNWSKNTVITLLNRMEKKGAAAYRYDGKARRYYPLYRREDAAIPETRSFLKKIYGGSPGLMVNYLIKQNALSDEELSEIYNILKEAEVNRK